MFFPTVKEGLDPLAPPYTRLCTLKVYMHVFLTQRHRKRGSRRSRPRRCLIMHEVKGSAHVQLRGGVVGWRRPSPEIRGWREGPQRSLSCRRSHTHVLLKDASFYSKYS